jgi:hypothetical protein
MIALLTIRNDVLSSRAINAWLGYESPRASL